MPEDPAVWRYPDPATTVTVTLQTDITDRICPLFMAASIMAPHPTTHGKLACIGRACAWYEKCSKP